MNRGHFLLGTWLAALTAVVLVLTPNTGLPRWSGDDETAAVELVISLARLLTLGMAWYLLAATVLALAARLATALEGAARVLAVAPVRRVVSTAVGVSLTAAAVTSVGVGASTAGPRPVIAAEAEVGSETMRRLPEEPSDLVMRRLSGADPDLTTEWRVEPGDHLWSVAERVLVQARGRAVVDSEIDPYWRTLIEINRSRLPDPANPDLVYPGEVLTVPPPPPTPDR